MAKKPASNGKARAKSGEDAISLLKADHRKVEDLFARYKSAKGRDRKAKIAKEVCTELMIHTIIEEELFYPAFRGLIENNALDEAYVEHDGAKVLIAELKDGDPEGDFYDAKLTVLSEDIKHHVREEEKRGGIFAQARKSDVDLSALGDKLARRKQELKTELNAAALPPPETRTFHNQKLKEGTPVAAA